MKAARIEGDTKVRRPRVSAGERQRMIVEKVVAAGFMSIAELGAELAVSEMTIRRDLDLLAGQDAVIRAHGGAISVSRKKVRRVDFVEPGLDERIARNHAAKVAIGRRALGLISTNQTIAIDIGSTTLCLAQVLMEMDVRVFTNSLKIALLLSPGKPRVYLPGGEISGSEPSVIGSIAQKQLENFRFDWAFLGAASMDEDGIYDYSLEDTEIKQSLVARSHKKVALVDSSKFLSMSVVKICGLQALDLLITDKSPTGNFGAQLKAAGVEILAADEDPRSKEIR